MISASSLDDLRSSLFHGWLWYLSEGPQALPVEALVLRLALSGFVLAVIAVAVAPRWRRPAFIAAGALLSLVFFEIVFGLRRVDPREYEWIMLGKDGRWHDIAWQFFRREPWHMPPGRIDNMLHPVGTSIANTDALPLGAFLFKPFDALLPPDFQYFGPWFLVCALLRGAFAGALLAEVAAPWPVQLAGLAILTASGAMFSADHAARGGFDWMILSCLWLYFRPRQRIAPRRETFVWIALATVAAACNAYLVAAVVALCAATLTRRRWPDRATSLLRCASSFAAVTAAILAVWWIVGYFELSQFSHLQGGGYGLFSMDLLAPINPMRDGAFLPKIEVGAGQYEGSSYLGGGMLALVLWALVSMARRRPSRATLAALLPLAVACAVLTFAALSWTITIAGQPVLEMPHSIYTAFTPLRASGRLFQPVHAAIVYLLIALAAARLRPVVATAVLAAVFVAQLHEGRGLFYEVHLRRFHPQNSVWAEKLDWDHWQEVTRGRSKLHLVGGGAWTEEDTVPFAYLAARSGLAFGGGEAARYDGAAIERARAEERKRWERGEIDPDGLYVVHPAALDDLTRRFPVSCRPVDGLYACQKELRRTEIDADGRSDGRRCTAAPAARRGTPPESAVARTGR